MNANKNHSVFKVFVSLTAMLLMSFSTINNRVISDFSLKDINGKYVSLKDFPDAKGFMVLFTCNHCPFANLYYSRMNELNTKYSKLGVPLLAISSSDTINFEDDTYEMMRQKAKEEHFNFPFLYDNMQDVAHDFNAQKTPHAYVIWKEQGKWVVKYNGAIDDNGAHADLVQHHYLSDAVDQLLSGKEVAVTETRSIGCQIGFRKR